ncbi:PEP/pyruvate-binding domain-containing protein, partial [Spirulina sp. 06S082]|uniref:PEP/pyruvate-binding domain-containing protein n=1 Tax=Spirulina sp. 06S082 TaxID=3110248 RepID=UPI002B20CF15
LDCIQPSQRSRVGEKAFVLSQLCQQGYPIPPGFAIATTVWQQFLMIPGESKPILTDLSGSSLHIDVKDFRALQQLARNICQDIQTVPLPSQWLDEFLVAAGKLSTPALILRPSLAIFDTVPSPIRGIWRSQVCWCEPQSFENALKQVWSELFRAKSLFYWQRAGIELDRIQMAILVQPMEEAIASGRVVADSTQWQIEATRGLGYSWIRGEVELETYRVNAVTKEIEAQDPGRKTRECYVREKPLLSSTNCLENRSLPEEEQENYVLDRAVLSQILTLTQRIQLEKSKNFSWEWVLSRTAKTPQLYLVQWNEEQQVSAPISSTLSLPLVTGVSASPGRAIAPVRVLTSPDDLHQEISVGEILVAKTLESYWFPLLKQAAGLVLEQGNLTSHGAILARELGIP